MTDARWFSTSEERSGSWRASCNYVLSFGAGMARCGHRTKKMGSEAKAETAIKDHLRDVHNIYESDL